MEEIQRQSRQRTNMRTREPEMYDVVLLNDDFTTMDFVTELLRTVFYLNEASAEKLMMAIHLQGEGVAGTYPYDIAASKMARATAMARAHDFPLQVEIRPHSDQQ